MGEMISPRNIAAGLCVTDLRAQEGVVLARAFKHSIVLTLLLGVVQRYAAPEMIPSQPAIVASAQSSAAAHPPPARAR